MKKRMTALILAAILLLLSACRGEEEETAPRDPGEAELPSEEAEEKTPFELELERRASVSDDLPDLKFEGETYTIVGGDTLLSYVSAEELTGEVFNDARFNRNLLVGERFGVDMEMLSVTDPPYTARISVNAGEDAYDLLMYNVIYMGTELLSGIYLDFRSVPYVDFTRPWWNKSTDELLTLYGRTFLALGALDLTTLAMVKCILFNLGYAEDLNLENIFSVVMEGRWTVDKLEEMASVAYIDVNGNGERDLSDRYGYVFGAGDTDYYLYSFGKTEVEVGPDGDLITDRYYDDKLVSIVERLYNLAYNREYVWYRNQFGEGMRLFSSGSALCAQIWLGSVGELMDTEIDYAVVPNVKWDEKQEQYFTAIDGASDAQAVLKTASNTELIGCVTEALNAESWKSCEYTYYEQTLKYRTLQKEENLKILDMIMDSRIYDFGYIYGGFTWNTKGGGACSWISDLIAQGSGDIASYYIARKKPWEKFMASVAAYFKEYED